MTKDEALAFVREYFAKHGDIDSDGCTTAADVMAIQSGASFTIVGPQPATLAEAIALGDDGPTLQSTYTAEAIDPLLDEAATDPVAYEAARNAAKAMLRQGSSMPPTLAGFAADALDGTNLPKKKPGADKRRDMMRNRRIILALHLLQEQGITPTRSDATDPDLFSGCDIIGEVLHKTPGAIAKVWANR